MRERAASQKAKLLKSDGGRLYSDEEHQKREQAIIGEMARVADEVSEEVPRLPRRPAVGGGERKAELRERGLRGPPPR